ncbi:hypothetical protein DVB37_22115 [Achromobacter sp. B7]|nr:hypothetical protein DVB37_22115 [Achromobacter sp. B7]
MSGKRQTGPTARSTQQTARSTQQTAGSRQQTADTRQQAAPSSIRRAQPADHRCCAAYARHGRHESDRASNCAGV